MGVSVCVSLNAPAIAHKYPPWRIHSISIYGYQYIHFIRAIFFQIKPTNDDDVDDYAVVQSELPIVL